MTPKTESGRALLADLEWTADVIRIDDAYLPAILAIEQEAASKAVAEVARKVAAMEIVGAYGAMSMTHNETIRRVLALIASERGS